MLAAQQLEWAGGIYIQAVLIVGVPEPAMVLGESAAAGRRQVSAEQVQIGQYPVGSQPQLPAIVEALFEFAEQEGVLLVPFRPVVAQKRGAWQVQIVAIACCRPGRPNRRGYGHFVSRHRR